MNPQMMKAAQDMMAKMSPDDMQRMMEMSKNMDPSMMQQAQQMMMNPDFAKTAESAMQNMSADDIKARMNSMPPQLPSKPAVPVSVAQRLRSSAMVVPEDMLELVEEAETQKQLGNKQFKEADFGKAILSYKQGSKALDSVLLKDKLSGADKQAVLELHDALHLNSANCRLKTEDWAAAVQDCDVVLKRGKNRKAFFHRGKAYLKQEQLEEAHSDLKAAADMDRTDLTVAELLRDVEKRLGVFPSGAPARAPSAASSSDTTAASSTVTTATPPARPDGMPKRPDGAPDFEKVEKMLDEISPDQMKAQAAMLENMNPDQLRHMAPQLAGMDSAQIKAMTQMMSNMDPTAMKSMAKMASQMGGGMPGLGGSSSASTGNGQASASGSGSSVTPRAPQSLSEGMDMMSNMSPEMMKAGVEMMKNMDPKVIGQMMGREFSEAEAEKMKDMMSNMTPEQMEKWMGRAQWAAKYLQKPLALFRRAKGYVGDVNPTYVLAALLCFFAVLLFGHLSEMF
eukprot:CAMPEP_0119312204 /NCGR_PEP_ID=MMETSP1333-20130426/25480_1 /TAXON_ID=418940 /ORGANISM="Scyphosphaera apsteinii, Strain RCC1455" /LENGTH=509 /DNA_ID=CAMNT_0007316791 /DNA_START=78 /DNA_END=1607 /DNA_ORIENTATION=-